jgi:hypothetical protein
MTFQSTVARNIGFGVPGEIFLDGPLRAQPGRLDSASAANNVVGRAFSIKDDATASFETAADPQPLDVQAGQSGVFAGILAMPKNYPLSGTAGDTLASSIVLPNDTMVELIQETAGMVVALGAACSVGDWLYYTTATGVLITASPGFDNIPADSTRVPGGRVVRYESAAAGLAVVAFNSNVDPQEAVA